MGESTHSTGPGPQKICVRCGRDCAGRRRSRDAQGRYVCGECLDLGRGTVAAPVFVYAEPGPEVEAGRGLANADPSAGTGTPVSSGAGLGGVAAPDPDVIPLADEAEAPAAPNGDGPRTCAHCGLLMSSRAVICTACGFDTRTGHTLGGPGSTGRKCISCGYSLQGLKGEQCPECGTVNTQRQRKEIAEKKAAREAVRDSYMKPLMMIGIGLGCRVVAELVGGPTLNQGMWSALGHLAAFAVLVPVGLIVYLSCCLFWIGFDAPIHLSALRIAAVYAMTGAVWILVAFIPIGIVRTGIIAIVHVGLMQDMLELDLNDAAIVGILTIGLWLFILIIGLAHSLGL